MIFTIRKFFVAVALALLAAGTGFAQQPTPQPNPVVHVEILGADAPRLQRFYTDLLGWKVSLNPIGYGYVPVAPVAPVALTGGVGPSPQGQPLTIFYVKVDDPAATLKRAVELGGKIVMPPIEVPGGITFARFADPEGNVIGLVRRPN
ncbi:MAG: VOC family protein [Betaproteobacteria bacterium]|nr:VOC family protein [Betaproteobacteria bacterium]